MTDTVNTQKPKENYRTNLFLLVLFSVITGGFYFPLWYLQKRNLLEFSKWIVVVLTIISLGLIAIPITSGVYSAKSKQLDSSWVLKDPEEWNQEDFSVISERIRIDQIVNYLDLGMDAIAAFLIYLAFATRTVINAKLKNQSLKTIPIWLYILLAIFFYILYNIGLGAKSGVSLLWSSLPLVFLLQLKINTLFKAPVPHSKDKYSDLERLSKLKEKGVLTEEEFAKEKSKLLG